MKALFPLLVIFLSLNFIKYSQTTTPEFCVKDKLLTNSDINFPDVESKETFYFKKIFSNNYIIGTDTSATLFSLTNTDSTEYTFEKSDFISNNEYIVYSDPFGNFNPIFGLDNSENPTKIKYILSEGIKFEDEYMHALYDIENKALKEGRLSDTFKDYKILETLNENEYLGVVKLHSIDNDNNNIYSIKLQLMSFNQLSGGRIKLLGAKEYATVINQEYNVNQLYFIKSLKKIMIIRTYQQTMYIDFIDYFSNSFGSLLVTKELEIDFNIQDYKFNSIELKTENDNTTIITCFRKLNYVYCFSGIYNKLINEYNIIQEKPILLMASCDNRMRPDINLLKINDEMAIVGCPGDPYHAVKFDVNFDKIGSEIIFGGSYSEFAVINDYSLFVIYRDKNSVSNAYELHGCIYYLPECEDTKVFLKLYDDYDIKDIFDKKDELKNMDKIYIISYSNNNDVEFKSGINNIAVNTIYDKNGLTYKYNPTSNEQSFEEIIIYKTVVNSDYSDYIAYSNECKLKIINCYKSCETCDNIGTDNSHNCKVCKNNYYFLDDSSSKMCYQETETPKNYYLDKTVSTNYIFKKCYESCNTCNTVGTPISHNCLSCYTDKGYYPITDTTPVPGTTINCYLSALPPDGYYFNKNKDLSDVTDTSDYFKQCDPDNNNHCISCSQELVELNPQDKSFCKKCDIANGYYALFDDDDSKKYAKCFENMPEGYFLDSDAGRYRKCYPTCQTCSQSGNDEYNYCDSCKSDFTQYIADSKTCKCEYNFYYEIDTVTNIKTFKCTSDFNCPTNYPYLIINSQNIRQCIKNCPTDYSYIYNMQCFNHKLNGTSFDLNNNEGIDDFNIEDNQCIINDYITSTIDKEHIKDVKQDYVNNYINEYNILNGYDYTYNHANIIRNDNEEYLLIVFQNENCLNKVRNEYGLNFIDLTDYAPIIKSKNGIDADDPLTYVYLYTEEEDEDGENNNGNINYECFNSETGEKLDLDEALNGQNITQHVTAPTGNDLQKLKYLSKYTDLGIDFSDPNSDFFNSQCFSFTSDKGKDVTLADRRKYFFNNIKICDDDCVFKGIDESLNTAKCSCPYNREGNTITKEITFPDYNEEYFIYDMWKCLSKKMVSGKELKKSYITIIVFCLLILTIIFTVLYFLFLKNKFKFISKITTTKYITNENNTNLKINNNNLNSNSTYKVLSQEKKSRTIRTKRVDSKLVGNPPPPPSPKDEGEKQNGNLMKEKGYVHDVKRPFNYDNNNLFFHADEHYTMGNKDLNGLFMGQNYKNDYTKEIEQFQNDEKKPKIINNYNNTNIPGNRLYKKNKTAFLKINNFNNINYASDIIKIDEEKETPINDIKNENPKNVKSIYIKNDNSDSNSVDPLQSIKNGKTDEKSDDNYTNIIPKVTNEDQIDEDIKKAGNEIGEENMKINIAEYEHAKKYDSREFCSFYFNQLKHRQIFLYTGYFHDLAEGVFMKIIILIFHILICLFFNLFWYRTCYVHDEFVSPITDHAEFSSKNAWFRILLSLLCYIIVVCLLHLIYLPQLKIYYTLVNEKIDNKKKIAIVKDQLKCMKINYIIFTVINFCFIIVLILYVLVFSYVFINSKVDLIISFVLTFILTQALPFIFVFFVACFRFIGLKCNAPCAYKFSLLFTI